MDELQSKVLNSEHDRKFRCKTNEGEHIRPLISQRYNIAQ